MKTQDLFQQFGRRILAATALAGLFLITSCDKDDDDFDDDENFTLSGNASGSQENPAVSTAATATLSGTYNSENNLLTYTINWTGLSGLVTGMHFHGPAAVGVNAGVIHGIEISTNGISGSASGSLTLADTTENHLLNGKLYYNIHTALYPNGEIRGQVTAED